MTHATLKIDGMNCGHCVGSVKKMLERLEGVTIETVAVGSATVSYDPAVATAAEILEAVGKAGYAATLAA